jgi:hypothetical protein
MTRRWLVVGLALSLYLGADASAQVVREDGVKSIAGTVGGGAGFAEWTFQSAGDEILFASLDAFIYEQRVPHEPATTEGSGCSDGGGGCSGEDEGGCSSSGPSRLCLQVIDAANQILCHATRPTPPPGWQRDPRLACRLPSAETQAQYRIRVVQVSMGMESGVACNVLSDGLATGDPYPFLLNVSLRRLAPSGVNIQAAFAQSLSRF